MRADPGADKARVKTIHGKTFLRGCFFELGSQGLRKQDIGQFGIAISFERFETVLIIHIQIERVNRFMGGGRRDNNAHRSAPLTEPVKEPLREPKRGEMINRPHHFIPVIGQCKLIIT